MQTTVLTPSQAAALEARAQRLARINARAVPDKPVECLSASVRSAAFVTPPRPIQLPAVALTPEQWVDRQKEIHAAIKEPWFQIVDEIGKRVPTIRIIQRTVAFHYGVSTNDIRSHARTSDMVRPRQVAAYLAKTMTPNSLPEIGRRFGGRDHTTILHSVRKIESLMARDAELSATVAKLTAEIEKEMEQ